MSAEDKAPTEQPDGVFIEIDEDDPFVGLQLRVLNNDGTGFIAGGIVPEPGRYELKKVDDGAEHETLCGDPDCSVCSSPEAGTCADGFSSFVDMLNSGGDSDAE